MSKLLSKPSYHHNAKKKIENYNQQELQPIAILINIKQIELPKKQPRQSFNPQKIEQLTLSIKEHGILEPLIVRPLQNNKYELVAGERRYRAAKKAGLSQIPVTVKELDDKQAFKLSLLENMQRDDLNSIDETEGVLELICQTLELSREEVIQLLNRASNAQKRGKSLTDNVTRNIKIIDELFLTIGRLNRESFRTNRLPLLNLPEDVLNILRKGKLEYTKAKAISKLKTKSQRRKLMETSINERLTLSQIKKIIKETQKEKEKFEEIKEVELKKIQSQYHYNTKPKISTAIEVTSLKHPENNLFKDPGDLYTKFKEIMQIHSDAWNDESKKPQIQDLLDQLKNILQTS